MALEDIRRASGYKTAKAFAQAIGIPYPTYIRYEGKPSEIPMRKAWELADVLGCTIDELVGRTVAHADHRRDLNRAYEKLSDGSKARMNEYLTFLAFRDTLINGSEE